MGLSRFDRDAFHSLRTKKAAHATAAVLSELQYRTPEEQIAGVACAFLLLCERYRMPAQDAFAATKQMMNHHDARGGTDFDGIRSYLDADVFGTRSNFPTAEDILGPL